MSVRYLKLAIWFVGSLGECVEQAAVDGWLEFLGRGALWEVLCFCGGTVVVFAIGFAETRLRADGALGIWLQRSLGGMFIALGVRLALTER